MKTILNIMLVFCYIFGFKFYGKFFFDSTMMVGVLLVLCFILNRSYLQECLKELKKESNVKLYIAYLFINIWAFFCIAINQSEDFSFLITFLHMLFIIITGIILYVFLRMRKKEEEIVNYIIIAFLLQTLIEWLAFSYEPVKELINLTKSVTSIEKGMEYSNIRANALAGSDFFGLSSAFAAVYLIYFSSFNTITKNIIIKSILFFFLLSGTFFAGRSGYIGFLIGLLYYAFIKIKKSKITNKISLKISTVCKFTVIIGLLAAICTIFIYEYNNNEKIERLLFFTFQSAFMYMEKGSIMVSSLETLSGMYFEIPMSTFLIGDAQYIVNNGRYYMNTDVGYMRVILYMGILGVVSLIYMEYELIKIKYNQNRILKKFLLILILILNFKGETLVWNQLLLATTILYSNQEFSKEISWKK